MTTLYLREGWFRPSSASLLPVIWMTVAVLQSFMFPACAAFSVVRTPNHQIRTQQSTSLFFPRGATTTASSYRNENDDFDFDDDDDDIDDEKETDDDDDDTINSVRGTVVAKKPTTKNRWKNLNPKIKARMIQAGQERAIANKQRRENAQDKKRRRYMFVKEQQVAKKRAARVQRPLDFDNRLPLSALLPGMEISGIVISLTDFGAYVDVGSTVDGLLHVSQLSSTDFVRHPRQRLSPGDEITVRVRSVNPEKSKLHLTMLPPEIVALQMQKENEKNMDTENNENRRISVQELFPDDELWGIITRVTDYGGYVDVGAVVDGFCHFMDHPDWNGTEHPRDIMKVGDRVRVWVMDASHENDRIKLSAVRPKHLPGPRREL